MKSFLAWTGAVIMGLVLGVGSAWACAALAPGWYLSEREGWRVNRAYGAEPRGPYMRAASAERPFSPPPSEIRFYLLDHDDQGAPLTESCIYELSAARMSARWWSVALYGAGGQLIANGDHAFSIDAHRAAITGAGGWRARLAPVRGETANWLSTRDARRGFQIGLRLYQERRDRDGHLAALPRLTKQSCAGGA